MPVARIQCRRMAAYLLCSPLVVLFCFHCLLLLVSEGVSAHQIIAGAGLGQNTREPRYAIEFHSAESPFLAAKEQESVVMSRKNGQKYLCHLPLVDQVIAPAMGSERRAKLKKPDEYLEPLKDTCIYYHEGWWVYELCHEKGVKQVHLEKNEQSKNKEKGSNTNSHASSRVTQEFILGEFHPESTLSSNQNLSDIDLLKDPRRVYGSQRYHVHQFKNGTVCDLTKKPRETEVRFVCGEHGISISSVQETETCKYRITVQCSLLCQHPMFKLEMPVSHPIHCNEIVPQEEKEEAAEGKQVISLNPLHDDVGLYLT